MAPIIGITFSSNSVSGTSKNYIRAIKKFGGEPCVLGPDGPDAKLGGMNGLLLTGGPDINPNYYDEERHETTEIKTDRDELELSLFNRAIEEDIPILGICRGIQVMNVAMKGSLYQDIPSQFTYRLTHKILVNKDDSWHDIQIQPDSLLNQITGETTTEVNSRHHQSLKVIGEGFTVTAQSKDGIIEAIEDTSKRFMLGVQYHPERMFKESGSSELQEHSAKLFTAFIDACS